MRREFLAVRMGNDEYGLDFRLVRELCEFKRLERFAHGGVLVDGVARSRGIIMPLVDLRAGSPAPSPDAEVLVLNLRTGPVALVVDEVVGLAEERQRWPEGGTIIGSGEVDGRRLLLLDAERLLAKRPLPVVPGVTATPLQVRPMPSFAPSGPQAVS
jgi:purine-binding chemotaxis protein CheW